MGSGMFAIKLQQTADRDSVENNFRTALFCIDSRQEHRLFRSLINIPSYEMRSIMENEISNQMGERFDHNHPENYTVTFDDVPGSYWDGWWDSYVYEDGDKTLQWGDPRTFWANRNFPNKRYLIATITSRLSGRSAKCRANCGNVLKPRGGQPTPCCVTPQPAPVQCCVVQAPVATYNTAPAPACTIIEFKAAPEAIKAGESTTLVWNTTCESVTITEAGSREQPHTFPGSGTATLVLKKTATFILTTSSGKTAMAVVYVDRGSFFSRNLGWIIPVGAVVLGGAAYLIFHGNAPAGGNHSYDNGFQGGSGSTPVTGGQGGQQTWFQRPTDVVTLYNF